MNAVIISKNEYFNKAFSERLRNQSHISANTLLISFDKLEASITDNYQLIFLLGYDIIGSNVLDIGYIWGNVLSKKSRVYIFDFDTTPDYGSNPGILNPFKNGYNNMIACLERDPVRKIKTGDNSFRKALQGLFRTHGHEGFLGELGKLQTFLMGGLEFYEESPHDPTIWKDFFQPAQRATRHLVNIFEPHRYLLDHWPVKETVNRLKNNIMVLKDWEMCLKSRKIDKIGTREKVLDTLDIIESDIIAFQNCPVKN